MIASASGRAQARLDDAPPRPASWWVRRDFRLADNPALRAAIEEGEAVLPLFVLDPVLLAPAGTARKAWLLAALRALDPDLREAGGPGLSVVRGRPAEAVLRVARECAATQVHVSSDFGPYGRSRDRRSRRPWPARGSSCAGPAHRTRWPRAP